MAERGYPTEGYEQQLSDLSVRHSRTWKLPWRHEPMRATRIEKSTEDLRDAMVRYRTVFEDLLTRVRTTTSATATNTPATKTP